MRFSTQILVSLLAITPVVVVSAPAPQDAYSSVVFPDVGTVSASASASDTIISSSAPSSVSVSISASAPGPGASGGAGGGKSCTRGRGGRGRVGHGRPTNLPSDSPPSSAVTDVVGPSSEYESPPIIEQPASESGSASASAPSTEVPEPSTPVEEAPAQEVPVASPSVQEVPAESSAGVSDGVDLAATGQSGPGSQQGGGAAQPSETLSAASSAASSAPATDTGSGGAAEGFEAEILRAHNEARAKFNAPPMTWNASSAKLAMDHFTSTGCVMTHSGFDGLGENLQGAASTGQESVDAWMSEEPLWTAGMEFESTTGHFTQVVWKGSTHLGCAQVDCGGGKGIVACEYSPPGNMLGDFKNNVGKT